MKQVYEFRSRVEWENYLWKKFLENSEKLKSDKRLSVFLDNLFTKGEKKTIVKRLAILALIKEGKSYREIGDILWVSPSSVSAIKKCALAGNGYFSNRHYADNSRAEKIKRMKPVPELTIFDYWLNMPLPTKTGRGRWKFLDYQGS